MLEETCCNVLLLKMKQEGLYSNLYKECRCIKEIYLGGFYDMATYYLAVDMGASIGRLILGHMENGRIEL